MQRFHRPRVIRREVDVQANRFEHPTGEPRLDRKAQAALGPLATQASGGADQEVEVVSQVGTCGLVQGGSELGGIGAPGRVGIGCGSRVHAGTGKHRQPAALEQGRHCLVLTQWTTHLDRLADALHDRGYDPVVLRGGMGAKARTAALTPTVARIGEVEYPAYHGVGRRDAMITDEDRRALAYFRAHPRGVRVGNLSPTQRTTFDGLLETFVHRARPGLVDVEMDRIAAAGGVEELHFAWAGGTTIDQPHYFRIQGGATLVEFDNAEDDANHVHSVWRSPSHDFADDLLLQHHLDTPHAGQHQ